MVEILIFLFFLVESVFFSFFFKSFFHKFPSQGCEGRRGRGLGGGHTELIIS